MPPTLPVLTSSSNSIGLSLTLADDDSRQLTSVTDNTTPARSVSYISDSAGNLASLSDPLGNATTYRYTPTGGTAPANLLTQIFDPSFATPFVSNIYDTLGRVASQTKRQWRHLGLFFRWLPKRRGWTWILGFAQDRQPRARPELVEGSNTKKRRRATCVARPWRGGPKGPTLEIGSPRC
jgi:hypothetical protein